MHSVSLGHGTTAMALYLEATVPQERTDVHFLMGTKLPHCALWTQGMKKAKTGWVQDTCKLVWSMAAMSKSLF